MWRGTLVLFALAACGLAPDEVEIGLGGTFLVDRSLSVPGDPLWTLDDLPDHSFEPMLWISGTWHVRPREVVLMQARRVVPGTPQPTTMPTAAEEDPVPVHDHGPESDAPKDPSVADQVREGREIVEGTAWSTIWKVAVLMILLLGAAWAWFAIRKWRRLNGAKTPKAAPDDGGDR